MPTDSLRPERVVGFVIMKLIVGRVLSAFLTAGGWLLAGVRLVLDLIGYSTTPEDVLVAKGRLDQLFDLILSAPWWAIWGFAFLSTFWLIWVSWPRTVSSGPAATLPTLPGTTPNVAPSANSETEPASPNPNEVDENIYNSLLWFCIDHLIPTCEAQISLQKRVIKALTNSGYVEMYAWRGAVDHFRSFGFWDNYEKLSKGLSSSPMAITSYNEIAECVAKIEKTYDTFCGQTHLLSNERKFDYMRDKLTADLWEEWRAKHNVMVTEFEKIKRDSRFGRVLFRPARESRWGGIIGPPSNVFG